MRSDRLFSTKQQLLNIFVVSNFIHSLGVGVISVCVICPNFNQQTLSVVKLMAANLKTIIEMKYGQTPTP